ncbi:uncharacterized protein LOC126982828 [Eriocheir sinensis]|uniref:uncharacterized protein LOC126982828 n=1 Tax=Eriocheir sinensis TaxID=95602 RepID=UPI0021C6142C|nr:uncharacterized protein LOC126982828 [Eriocheir sinensis]
MKKRASLIRQLQTAYNPHRKSTLINRLTQVEREIKASHEKQQIEEENKAVSNIKENRKYFYSYCKKFSITKSKIGPLETQIENPAHTLLPEVQITTGDIKKATRDLRTNSAAGPNGVPATLLLHLGDITTTLDRAVISSFADDTNISQSISTPEDVNSLQQDLNNVYTWATQNNMNFNQEKTELLRCGPNQNIKNATKLYTEGGHKIVPQSHVKCLGVHLSSDTTFTHHIMTTVKKAKAMAGRVLRTFSSREPLVMLTLWKSLVQPILDYCSQLWSPHKKGDIQLLEAVQRSYTRQISGMKELNYWHRLHKLGLLSQQRRRDRYRAIYTCKILEGTVPDPTPGMLTAHISGRAGRMCSRYALPTRAPGKIRTQLVASLAHDSPKIFNALPKEVRGITGCSVDRFKAALDRFLRAVPDEPPVPGYTAVCRAASNSIPDQVRLKKQDASNFQNSGGPPRL